MNAQEGGRGPERLARDRACLSAQLARLRADLAPRADSSRLLVLLCARRDADALLAGTVPSLIEMADDCDVGVDLVLAVDGGPVDARFVKSLQHGGARVTELDLVRDRSSLWKQQQTAHGSHRVSVLWRATRGPRGKIRVLRDVCSRILVGPEGASLPALTLLMDADSRLFDARHGNTRSGRAAALERLMARAREPGGPDLLGARLRFAPFRYGARGEREARVPDLGERVHPVLELINGLHGWFPGFRWLPGGGTIGRSDVVLSVMAAVAEAYPAQRVEDVHASVLAHGVLRSEFSRHILVTNESRGDALGSPAPSAEPQMLRWLRGVRGLERIYGEQAVRDIAGGWCWSRMLGRGATLRDRVAASRVLGSLLTRHPAAVLLDARRDLHAILAEAARTPDHPERASACAAWS